MSVRETGQVLIYNSKELALIKNTFAENENLLYTIRKVLLQFPLSDIEKMTLKAAMTPELFNVVKKRLFPDIDPDAPLTQLGDLYQSLNNDLKVKDPLSMAPLFAAKKIEIEYLAQQFEALQNIDNPVVAFIVLDNLKYITDDMEQNYVNTTARNFLLSYIDSFLNLLKNLAGAKEETPEEQTKRLARDSSK